MEDNVFESSLNAEKNITYRLKLHKLLEHCLQELGALNSSLSSVDPEDSTYVVLYNRVKALQQRQEFYQAQLNNFIVS